MTSRFRGIDGGNKFFGGRIVGINDTVCGFFEELTFGFDIVVKGFVVVEVFVGDVSHNGNFDGDAKGAKLGEGMGGNFEDEVFCAGIFDSADTLVKNEGISGGHMLNGTMKGGGV